MTINVSPEEVRAFETRLSGWFQARLDAAMNAFQEFKHDATNKEATAAVAAKQAVAAYDQTNPKPKLLPNV